MKIEARGIHSEEKNSKILNLTLRSYFPKKRIIQTYKMEFSDICPFHNCLSWKGSLLFENLHSHTYLSLRPLDLWTFIAKFQISKAHQRAILCKWQIEKF